MSLFGFAGHCHFEAEQVLIFADRCCRGRIAAGLSPPLYCRQRRVRQPAPASVFSRQRSIGHGFFAGRALHAQGFRSDVADIFAAIFDASPPCFRQIFSPGVCLP